MMFWKKSPPARPAVAAPASMSERDVYEFKRVNRRLDGLKRERAVLLIPERDLQHVALPAPVDKTASPALSEFNPMLSTPERADAWGAVVKYATFYNFMVSVVYRYGGDIDKIMEGYDLQNRPRGRGVEQGMKELEAYVVGCLAATVGKHAAPVMSWNRAVALAEIFADTSSRAWEAR